MPKLNEIIARLLDDAPQAPDMIAARTLPNGLTVALKYRANQPFVLQISRRKMAPSEIEWRTVLASFPGKGAEALGAVERLQKDQFFYLRAPVELIFDESEIL